MVLDWRIRESGHGGFIAQGGRAFTDEDPYGRKFERYIAFETARFDTRKEAERYIARRRREVGRFAETMKEA